LVADLKRIDHIAFRLGHFLFLCIANHSGDVDLAKWNIAHELEARHHHAGDPEENDVVSSHQEMPGIERLQIVCLFRPAESGKRPELRTEPGIENVRILTQLRRTALRTAIEVAARNGHRAALVAVPGRYAVSPPQLTRNAPIPN